MTAIRFSRAFRSTDLQQTDVPVEVRSENLKVVGRTTSSQELDVEPGHYFVTALLPAGRELFGSIHVGEDPAVVELLPEEGDEPPPDETLEPAHFLTPTATADVDAVRKTVLETLGPSGAALAAPVNTPVTLRHISGNVLSGDAVVGDAVSFQPSEGSPIPFYPSGAGPWYVQLTQAAAGPVTLAVPSGPGASTRVLFRAEGESWTLDVHVGNPTANLLLAYRANGYAQHAAEATDSPSLNAEKLLQEKTADPIAAAVGAYALLRFAEVDRLHDWTENLRAWFAWLPDGAAIRGEHLARTGDHRGALQAFLELHDRGLPMFTDGFSYALDRLRIYVEVAEVVTSERAGAEELLTKLKRLAPAVDDGSPVLVIAGDPIELLGRRSDVDASEAGRDDEVRRLDEQTLGA